jgi:hypothetical protein
VGFYDYLDVSPVLVSLEVTAVPTTASGCTSGFCVAGVCCSTACAPPNGSGITDCGACGAACPAPANATAVCTGGVCAFICDIGYTNCNGVCVNELIDANNCGGCGVNSPIPDNAFICSTNNLTGSGCAAGVCTGTCNTGWGDWDNDKSVAGNGCQANLGLPQSNSPPAYNSGGDPDLLAGYARVTTLSNCGACGVNCDDGSDGDGLSDSWETPQADPYVLATNPAAGVDLNCNGIISSADGDLIRRGAARALPAPPMPTA